VPVTNRHAQKASDLRQVKTLSNKCRCSSVQMEGRSTQTVVQMSGSCADSLTVQERKIDVHFDEKKLKNKNECIMDQAL